MAHRSRPHIWEDPAWPALRYDAAALTGAIGAVAHATGRIP
ncbi:DUF4172 domain-containing protein [Nocardia sp. NPDC050717]